MIKHTIKVKAQQIAHNPLTQKALYSMKPEKSLWGFLGVLLFFIVPEVIAFTWGSDITSYAKTGLLTATSFIERQYYELLVMLFEEGGSWINIAIAAALLIWLLV